LTFLCITVILFNVDLSILFILFYLYLFINELSGISEMLKTRDLPPNQINFGKHEPETDCEQNLKAQSDIYLINEIKNGSGDAFGILAERYNYIISYNLAKLYSSFNFCSPRSDKEDLLQECRIILYKAAKYFDFMKNVKFSTYANICIKNHLVSLRRKYAGYDFIPLDEIRENESGRYDKYFAFTDFNSFMNSFPETFFDALTVFEKKVLIMYVDDKSYKYMAEILNKSVKSIDNAVCRIKSKLKPYAEYFASDYN